MTKAHKVGRLGRAGIAAQRLDPRADRHSRAHRTMGIPPGADVLKLLPGPIGLVAQHSSDQFFRNPLIPANPGQARFGGVRFAFEQVDQETHSGGLTGLDVPSFLPLGSSCTS